MSTKTTQKTQHAQRLIEQTFGQDRDLRAEYPLVFDPSFGGSLVGVEKEGEVVSACAIVPRDLVLNGWLLRVGLIGSVTTAEGHRGQGYARQVLEGAEHDLFCNGAVMSLLWADDPKVYEAMGYVPLGTELDYRFEPKDAAKLPEAEGVRWVETRDHAAMHALYVRHSHRVDRNLAETSALLHGPEINALVCERNGEVVAYALMGRGRDLQGVVHEWAGETDVVLACVRGMLENLPEECPGIYFIAPVTSVDMRRGLLEREIPALEGVLGMAKVIDMPGLAGLFQRFGSPLMNVTAEADGLCIRGPKGSVTLDRQKALLACMPPQGNRAVVDALEDQTGLRFDGLPCTHSFGASTPFSVGWALCP